MHCFTFLARLCCGAAEFGKLHGNANTARLQRDFAKLGFMCGDAIDTGL
jgi:hypothetical protein